MKQVIDFLKSLDFQTKIIIGLFFVLILVLISVFSSGSSSPKNNTNKQTSNSSTTKDFIQVADEDELSSTPVPTINNLVPTTPQEVGSAVITQTNAPTSTPVPTIVSNPTPTLIPTIVPTNTPYLTPTPRPTAVLPSGVSLSATTVNLYPNEKQQIIATVEPNNSYNKDITWTYNGDIISIEPSGLITAKKVGKTNVLVKTVNGKTNNISVNVNSVPVSTPTSTPIISTPTPTPTPIPTKIPTLTQTPTITSAPTSTIAPTIKPTVAPTHSPADYFTAGFNSYVYQSGKTKMNYWLYVPKNTLKSKKMPLLVFLHGSGETGDNANRLLHSGTIPYYLKNGREYDAFILAPQSSTSWTNNYKIAKLVIDKIIADYNIDTSRISVTGHSYGGAGAWLMAANYPTFFSCAVPVSALGVSTSLIPQLVTTKIWAWHGTADTAANPTRNVNMVNAITRSGGDAKITLLEGKKHAITDIVYIDNDMINWMISQKRK